MVDVTEEPRAGVLRAVRVVLDPTPAQDAALASHAGAARAAFNYNLAAKVAAHRAYAAAVAYATYLDHAGLGPDAAYAAAKKTITASRAHRIPGMSDSIKAMYADPDYAWLPEVNRYAISSGMRNADTAWANWVASLRGARQGPRVGYPRFKKKGRSRPAFALYHDVKKPSLRPDGYRRWLFPGKVGGSIRVKGNVRKLARRIARGTARVKHVTISQAGGRWVASILVEDFAQLPSGPTRRQARHGTIGVDLGVSSLAALSTGDLIPNPRHLRGAEANLAAAQRQLARTRWRVEATGDLVSTPVRGRRYVETSGRRKARARLMRAHSRVAQARAATIHGLTKHLATEYARVVIEDLAVKNMTAAPVPRPDPDRPGAFLPNGRRAKAGLNRSLSDVAMGEIRRQLEYKTQWYGSTLQVVDRFFPSSKTCSACGAVRDKLRLADRVFRCPACGHVEDRDINAAKNIAAAVGTPTDSGSPKTPAEPSPDISPGPAVMPEGHGTKHRPPRSRKGPPVHTPPQGK